MHSRSAVRGLLAIPVLALTAVAAADTDPHGGMLRYPDVSASHVVFSYGGDLWTVPRAGGVASPLASPDGTELFPKFSADGETIAFVGNYEGDTDLYTIPASGGAITQRITHHPAGETLCDWTSDDRLLFYASNVSGLSRMPRLHFVSAEGGLPEALPLPYGMTGAISADGQWLAYTPNSRDTRTWKRYRGGMASDIWLFNLETHESKRMTDWEGTDTLPMWHGSKVYYLSDAGEGHRLNLWVYDTESGERRQVTRFTDWDVKWPSIGPGPDGEGEIVFQYGSGIWLLGLRGDNAAQPVEVTIPGDRPTLRPKTIDAARYTTWWHVSSTGKRAVVEARGDIWTAPAEHGSPRNLTRTDGVAERSPVWSPDGRWIAYYSDTTDEYELYVTQSDGKGETKQLTSDGGPFKYEPVWSPDSKHILFSDKTGAIHLLTIESGEVMQIDKDPWTTRPDVSWSHDSRWIAYARASDENVNGVIWIYEVETGEKRAVTSDMFSSGSPAFDRKGDYLYFASQRTFSPRYSDLDTTFIYDDSAQLYAVPLRADIESPYLPESDEETWDDEKKDDEDGEGDEDENGDEAEDADDDENGNGNGDDENGDEAASPDDPVSGTWEGTAATPEGEMPFTMSLTLAADNSVTGYLNAGPYSGDLEGTWDPASKMLTASMSIPDGPTITFEVTIENGTMTGSAFAEGDEVAINATRSAAGEEAEDGKPDKAREVVEIDFEGFEQRAIELPVPRGRFGRLAVNHKNELIYARYSGGSGGGLKIFDIEDDKKEEKSITGGTSFEMTADGKKVLVIHGSGASIFNASAGAKGERVKTDGMNARIDPRSEWAQLFADTWRIFRDYFYVDNMHGVDWPAMRTHYEAMLADCVSRDDVNYVIGEMISELNVGHAYRGGGDLDSGPNRNVGLLACDFTLEDGAFRIATIYEGGDWDADARGPLSAPGVDVKEGDYLLAVNGIPLDPALDPWHAFIDTAGRETILTVSDKPEHDDEAREVIVKPIGNDFGIRYRAWIEANRAYVHEKTGGKVGYIYVPNTGVNGQNDLFRQFFGQRAREGLIIDERWNGGGQIPTRFIELLGRTPTNYWARRDGNDWTWPPDAHFGPKCMLINGLAGSGGDMFPWLFRQAELGKLIGTRTWGGLVGISGNPRLIDGGFIAVPTFGFYEVDGTWGVEGHGTDPDLEVIDDPALMWDGGDPQLDAAIEHMLAEIERIPYVPPTRPAPPDRSGMGVTEEDK